MRILLTGGGTGGHLAVVDAMKTTIAAHGDTPFYIGSTRGQDRDWFEKDATFAQARFLRSRGVVNRRGLAKLEALGDILKAAKEAASFIKEYEIDAVFSVGGFSAAPASLAAIWQRKPLFIHEQNAHVGTLNRVLRPFAARFFTAFGKEAVPYPVRPIFFETARRREALGRIVFLGGSQGATAVNDFALACATRLQKMGVRITHQTGPRDFERVSAAYARMGIDAEVFAFDTALYKKIAAADFAVSRAGASTLWELAANRIPTLFVPYPYAAGDHQYRNAAYLADKSAAYLMRQDALNKEAFFDILARPLAPVSDRLADTIAPGGAEMMYEMMVSSL